MIGLENLRHSLDQSDAKLKSVMSWSPTFSCALGSLVGFFFTLSSCYLFKVFSFILIGPCDYFCLVLCHSIKMSFNPCALGTSLILLQVLPLFVVSFFLQILVDECS